MRIASFKPVFVLAVLGVLGALSLAACDSNVPQKIKWEPGDGLDIAGPLVGDNNEVVPFDGLAPGNAYFYVEAHNKNWTYSWAVSPDIPAQTLQDGQFFRIEYDEPGTYTVAVQTTIEGQEYDDTLTVAIAAPVVAGQIGRLPVYTTFNSLLAISSLGLPDSSVTVLAPTDDAFLATFDADGDGMIEDAEVPADSVLTDLLSTLVIPQTLTPDDVSPGATFETLEGQEITFEGSGEALEVVVQNERGEVITRVPASFTGLPVTDGTIIQLGGVLTPAAAEVQFNDQAAADTVVVASVFLSEGGFVAIHDSTLLDGVVLGSVIGVSEKLEAGFHNNVEVALFQDVPGAVYTQDSLQVDQTLIAMPHRDTNDNGVYDFITSGGTMDGPYTDTEGPDDMTEGAVTDPAFIDAPPYEE